MARAGAEHTSLGAIPARHRLPQNPSDKRFPPTPPCSPSLPSLVGCAGLIVLIGPCISVGWVRSVVRGTTTSRTTGAEISGRLHAERNTGKEGALRLVLP